MSEDKNIPNLTEKESEKVVVMMPTFKEMVKKLEDQKLFIGEPTMDSFLKKFVSSVADSEKVGAGLNMAWELAKYDSFQGYPPIITALADVNFEHVIDAVTPDPRVANDAKEFRNKVKEEIKKNRPTPNI